MSVENPVPLLTAEDVARRLSLPSRTVRRWAAEGRMPSLRLGGTVIRFRETDIEDWLGRQQEGVAR